MAREGAAIVVAYLDEHRDAMDTRELVKEEGGDALLLAGDISKESFCKTVIAKTVSQFGSLDILVNNAAEQHVAEDPTEIDASQLRSTFETNIFSMFHMTKFAIPHMKKGSAIINTASVTAYKGSETLIDYSATKGAIVAFTRSLSQALVKKGIRVNAVAPGPIWTRSYLRRFRQRAYRASAAIRRWGDPANPMKWRLATYSWPPRTLRT